MVPSNVSSYKKSEGPYVTNDTTFKTTLIFNKPYGVSFAQSVMDLMSTKVCLKLRDKYKLHILHLVDCYLVILVYKAILVTELLCYTFCRSGSALQHLLQAPIVHSSALREFTI